MTTADGFDVIVVGTGFASSFFLLAYLRKARANERILVLERGHIDTHAWQIEHEKTSRISDQESFVNRNPAKLWQFNLGFGGGSNCWWANTPRMLPSDFELHSRYGVGVDWPLTYSDLEPYYSEVEHIMAISGSNDNALSPRSEPYPQPPHRFADPDFLFKAAYPDLFFNLPTARARVATAKRGRCCASGVCYLCPVNAKFTVLNEMRELYADERVSLELGASVQALEVGGNVAKGVRYTQGGTSKTAEATLVVLGANALFNPHILLRSGFTHPLLGKGLNEQVGLEVSVDLSGIDNYRGSTSETGIGYMLYDGGHRAQRAAGVFITNNSPQIDGALRLERGRWRQRLLLGFSFEDLRSNENYVAVSERDPERPETVYKGHSDYTQRSIVALPQVLPKLLASLPVEGFTIGRPAKTEAHILGTTVMGKTPQDSIIDRHLVHHQVRNLLVLGSGAFPTTAPAHPTLTLSALPLWAAAHL
jgi:choline dehydrogenase-like flavoprotein